MLRNNTKKQETSEHQWFALSHAGHPSYENYHSQIPDAHQSVKPASQKRQGCTGTCYNGAYDHKGRSGFNCLDLPLWIACHRLALRAVAPEVSYRLPADTCGDKAMLWDSC